ncbi:hypothetical protein CBQ26_11310 [Deinococcus indicus]|uniref:LPS-assembly protein LptD n=1 Tax=Deinococcus indicus TaxID=223556 RepID=A0A246BKN6_9DEIO|nr:hypothetical protein [Deinococcus indicus]OWL95849.1 hypothetical protein CBQ26_11310 [Deinococcus indicus]GHG24497.1 hypothetical protein GCM10017784_15740 [Deinococcus indicus]
MSRVRGGRRGRRVRAALLGLGLLGLGLLDTAGARTVRIISADTLELRQVDGQELVIISGEAVELRVDDDVVRARRVEFNRTRRVLTLVGAASYRSARDSQDLRGENLVVELGQEQVTGEDVLISDSQLEIRGQEVERIPGQLRAAGGYFTTCARCGRTPNDFAFRAERLIVYPGDRLVAYRAQLLLADVPVLFLPVLVLPLNDRERQPRLEIGQDAVDGYTVQADLPFSVGSSTLGTTLLRYYQNRDPSVGLGVSLRSFAPLPLVDRLNLYALANPRPVGSSGYDLDLEFGVRGRLPLDLALRDLDYTLNVSRSEVGRSDTDPQRGVTNVTFGAKADYPLFTADFNYINRFGPEPTTPLSTPLKLPEVTVDPKVYTSGNLSADVRVTAGRYTGASNPLSRSASAQGPNVTTERLEEQHALSYTARPWQDADLSLKNTFTGRYYGTGARTVQLTLGATLTQRFNTTNTLSVSGAYNRTEGTSPFAFDALGGRLLSAPLGVTLSAVPARDVTFGASYSRDLFLSPEQQGPLNFTLRVNRRPLTLDASSSVNLYTRQLDSASFTATLSDPDAGQVTAGTAVSGAVASGTVASARPRSSAWPAPNLALSASGSYARQTGPGPLTLRATVTGDVRTNTFSAYLIHNVRTPDVNEIGVSYTLARTRDTVLNALTLSGSERLLPRTTDQGSGAQLIGDASLTWRGAYRLSTAHSLLLNRPASAPDSGTLTFSVGTVQGSATNWNVTYGGPYDLVRGGFTRPALSGSVNATRPGQNLALSAALNTPGLDQPRTELSRASLDASWLFGTRAALAGRAAYTRTRSGTFPNDRATDTLTLDPVRLSVGIGRSGQAPGAYLSGSLRQTFTWLDGVRQNPAPLSPVIGLTIDRCCWALQAEADLGLRRYRLAVGLPGQTFYPLFDLTDGNVRVPLVSP